MTFKQNSLFLRQFLIFELLLLLLGVPILLIRAGEKAWMILLCAAAMVLCLYHTWTADPEITIDPHGICCTRSAKYLWSFSWSEIAQLRRITHYGSPAVQINPVQEPPRDFQNPQEIPFYGFQLSRSAKKTLELYCPDYRK